MAHRATILQSAPADVMAMKLALGFLSSALMLICMFIGEKKIPCAIKFPAGPESCHGHPGFRNLRRTPLDKTIVVTIPFPINLSGGPMATRPALGKWKATYGPRSGRATRGKNLCQELGRAPLSEAPPIRIISAGRSGWRGLQERPEVRMQVFDTF